MKLFIGVHHNPPDGPGPMGILLGTQALFHDYVMGPKYPATHAFVVVELEGQAWVLDGQPPHALWTPCRFKVEGVQPVNGSPPRPTQQAIWEIVNVDTFAGLIAARSLDGTQYDWVEIAAAAATAFSVLPGLQKLKMLGRVDLLHDAMICTRVATQVLQACACSPTTPVIPHGGPSRTPPRALKLALDNMPDLFPERLAQVLRGGLPQVGQWVSPSWCRRVVP